MCATFSHSRFRIHPHIQILTWRLSCKRQSLFTSMMIRQIQSEWSRQEWLNNNAEASIEVKHQGPKGKLGNTGMLPERNWQQGWNRRSQSSISCGVPVCCELSTNTVSLPQSSVQKIWDQDPSIWSVGAGVWITRQGKQTKHQVKGHDRNVFLELLSKLDLGWLWSQGKQIEHLGPTENLNGNVGVKTLRQYSWDVDVRFSVSASLSAEWSDSVIYSFSWILGCPHRGNSYQNSWSPLILVGVEHQASKSSTTEWLRREHWSNWKHHRRATGISQC